MRKVFIIGGFLILLISNSLYIIINIALKKALQYEIVKCKNLLEEKNFAKNILEDNILNLTINSGKLVNPNIRITAEDGSMSTIGQITSSKPVLIFKYFKESCHSCVEKEFEYMQQVFNEDELQNIIVLTTEKEIKKIQYIKKRNGINIPFFIIETDFIGLPLDKKKKPFLFTLGNSYYPENIFIPVDISDSLSLEYYKMIKSNGILNSF